MRRIDIDDPEVDIDPGSGLTYQGRLFTGEAEEISPQGVTITISTYVDGHEEGPHLEWYNDGTPRVEGTIRNYRRIGTWRRWHPSGRLAEEVRFSDDGELVLKRRWDESGAPVEGDSDPEPW
jgi:antitoxin component YwqK of YwqJK toxin-antitoxin module